MAAGNTIPSHGTLSNTRHRQHIVGVRKIFAQRPGRAAASPGASRGPVIAAAQVSLHF